MLNCKANHMGGLFAFQCHSAVLHILLWVTVFEGVKNLGFANCSYSHSVLLYLLNGRGWKYFERLLVGERRKTLFWSVCLQGNLLLHSFVDSEFDFCWNIAYLSRVCSPQKWTALGIVHVFYGTLRSKYCVTLHVHGWNFCFVKYWVMTVTLKQERAKCYSWSEATAAKETVYCISLTS